MDDRPDRQRRSAAGAAAAFSLLLPHSIAVGAAAAALPGAPRACDPPGKPSPLSTSVSAACVAAVPLFVVWNPQPWS